MKSERVENWWCGFEWCILSTEKLWSSNKFKKMKSLCNRRVSVWNPDTSKEIVRFVHEVHPVSAVTLSTSCTFYVGQMMIPCQLSTFSEFIWNAFQFQGHLGEKNSKCMKEFACIPDHIPDLWVWNFFFACVPLSRSHGKSSSFNGMLGSIFTMKGAISWNFS